VEDITLLFMAIYIRGWYSPATVIDAQVNYELPKLKSTLKLGLQILVGRIWTSIRAGLINNTLLLGQLTRKLIKF
jgi:hypothetical protein